MAIAYFRRRQFLDGITGDGVTTTYYYSRQAALKRNGIGE